LEHQPEAPAGWSVDELLETDLAAGTERDPGVVLQRNANVTVDSGPQSVGLEDDLAGLGADQPAVTHDERRSRDDLDPSRGRRWLLPQDRRGGCEHECEDARPASAVGHVISPERAVRPSAGWR